VKCCILLCSLARAVCNLASLSVRIWLSSLKYDRYTNYKLKDFYNVITEQMLILLILNRMILFLCVTDFSFGGMAETSCRVHFHNFLLILSGQFVIIWKRHVKYKSNLQLYNYDNRDGYNRHLYKHYKKDIYPEAGLQTFTYMYFVYRLKISPIMHISLSPSIFLTLPWLESYIYRLIIRINIILFNKFIIINK